MKLGIPIYDGVNLLDVAGPLEMFYWAGRRQPLETVLLSQDGKSVKSINYVRFDAQASFAEVPKLDILWVPGGSVPALKQMMAEPNSEYLEYLRQVSVEAKWVCSVCEGALLAAKAGILDGHEVTTHWAFFECLKKFPKITINTDRKRYVVSGNRLTGGGVSAGLDEALALIMILFGKDVAESVQRTTEYFPNPPVKGELPPTPSCPLDRVQ